MRKMALFFALLPLSGILAAPASAQQDDGAPVSILVMKKTAGDEKARGFLGVAPAPVPEPLAEQLGLEEGTGVVIDHVVPDSPAAEAGLKRHDVLVAVDGEPIRSPDDLREKIGAHRPGDEVRLTVIQRGERKEITVQLAEAPEQPFEVEVLPAPRFEPHSPGAREHEEEEWEWEEGAPHARARRLFDEMRRRMRAFAEQMPERREMMEQMRRALEEARGRIAHLEEELARRGVTREQLERLARQLAEEAQEQLERLRGSLDREQLEKVQQALERMVERVRAAAEGRSDRPDLQRLDQRMRRIEERMERIERLLERRLGAEQEEREEKKEG